MSKVTKSGFAIILSAVFGVLGMIGILRSYVEPLRSSDWPSWGISGLTLIALSVICFRYGKRLEKSVN